MFRTNMEAFFKDINSVEGCKQVIIGITIKDTDTRASIENLDDGSYNMIKIIEKAFAPIVRADPSNYKVDPS